MIVIASIKGIVMSSRYREFSSKPQEGKEAKTYKLNEITFFAPDLNITGVLKDWDLTCPADSLQRGAQIIVHFNRCAPSKGMQGVFDFSGYPTVK